MSTLAHFEPGCISRRFQVIFLTPGIPITSKFCSLRVTPGGSFIIWARAVGAGNDCQTATPASATNARLSSLQFFTDIPPLLRIVSRDARGPVLPHGGAF